MRVLFIQAYLGRKELPIFPLGLSMIATVLEGHDVRIYDPNVVEDPYGELKNSLKEFQPEVIGISLRNIDSQHLMNYFYYFKTLKPTLNIIKEVSPQACVLVGGAGYSMFPKEVMDMLPEIDFGIYLEGEESVPELLRNLYNPEMVKGVYQRKDNRVLYTGNRLFPDFSTLPAPRKDLVNLDKYSFHQDGVGIQTKRGCACRCSYCTYYNLNGNKVRMRSAGHVVDEIEELVCTYKISSFMFADALFTMPRDHAAEICHEIIRRKLKVSWSAWAEPRLMTKDFLILAKEAGCTFIAYSPDAISNEALKALGKGITGADVKKVYKLAKEVKGIKTGFGFFVCPPGETLKGFFKTIAFFIRGNLELRIKGRRGGIGLNYIRIEPDTRVYDRALSEGIISKDTKLLPEPEAVKVEEIFYIHPPLRGYDKLIRIMYTILDFSKGIMDTLRGKRIGR
jgi:radical SAM superfamily enzyme YgiQ (UPF0313 family)